MARVTAVSTQPVAVDPFGEIDPEVARYRWALRRHLRDIVIVAVVGMLLGALLVGASTFTSMQRIAVDDASDVLASTGMTTAFSDLPPIHEVRDFLNDPVLVTDAPDGVTTLATLDPTTGTGVLLTVEGPDREAATETATSMVSGLDTWIGERRRAAADDLIAVVADQRTRVDERLAALDQEIASLPSTDALRDAFLDERADLVSRRLSYDGQEQALNAYANSARRLTIIESESESSNSRWLWGIVGLILGALLAAIAVLVFAHTDRRVRTRTDLGRVTVGEILPVVPSGGSERARSVKVVDQAMRRLAGDRPVTIVPVANGGEEVAAGLVGELSGVTLTDLDAGSGLDGSTVFLAVAAGKAHAEDVARATQYLAALGHPPAGAILGVPVSELRRASL
jgi:hypothetical protein